MRGQSAAKAHPTGASSRQIRGPIDLDHLRRQTLGDSGLEMEVLRLFDEMTHVYYGRLESSTTVSDLLANLHTLKGAAAGVGAFGLAELARHGIEHDAAENVNGRAGGEGNHGADHSVPRPSVGQGGARKCGSRERGGGQR